MQSLAGAASTAVSELLTGPSLAGLVVGVYPSCAYVVVGDRFVAIETSDALGLPCAVRLVADRAAAPLRAIRPGDAATVGLGRVVAGDLEVTVSRWWAPRRPLAGVAPERLGAMAGLLAAQPCPVPADAEAAELVGLGDGLTPAGDDVLAGFLVAAHHCPDVRDPVAEVVLRLAPTRTTHLSAALLRHAVAGAALPAVVAVADLLAGHGPERALEPAVARLLSVGHSSGTALAHGLLRGARAVARHDGGQEAAA